MYIIIPTTIKTINIPNEMVLIVVLIKYCSPILSPWNTPILSPGLAVEDAATRGGWSAARLKRLPARPATPHGLVGDVVANPAVDGYQSPEFIQASAGSDNYTQNLLVK